MSWEKNSNKKPGILTYFCFCPFYVCFNLLSSQKLKPPLVSLSQLELDTSDLSLVFYVMTQNIFNTMKTKKNSSIFS